MTTAAKLKHALERAQVHAPYLRLLSKRYPDSVEQLKAGQLEAALVVHIDERQPVRQALRQAKSRLALSVAIGDIAGVLSLHDVVTRLSTFADDALDLAIRTAISEVVPGAEPQGFAAIALGKHGSCELNYSSDIDPIFIFDPLTLPCRARDEPVETAVRIAQRVLDIMQARDGDGYVFRVDLRLRPHPEATPLALPVNAAISYYESTALAWERAAFIRARACAGDMQLGSAFLASINPFIWRSGIDFGIVRDIHSISHRIRDHYADGQTFGPGYDLKRGRGGIRECEFYAQIHQLIHGGRDSCLRDRATLPALSALAAAGWIEADVAETLSNAYQLYRTIEHRLQMVDDQQTHSLPEGNAALDNVARLHGLKSGTDLQNLLEPHVVAVGAIYDQIYAEMPDQLPFVTDQLIPALKQLGLTNCVDVARRVTTWRSGKYRATRSASASEALESVLPSLLKSFAGAPNALIAINRFDQMVERLPSAVNLFVLLNAQPSLLGLLIKILCHAPTLADALARQANLLDGLIDATALMPVADVATLEMRLQHENPEAHLELRLERIRRIVGELRFALGVQLVGGTSDPLDVAKGYARVAEAAVRATAKAISADFSGAHGHIPGRELVVMALGRLGGAQLTHASDLDLIFVFAGDYRGESDGPKPLGTMHYFNRLAQRIISALAIPTANGPLYDVDTRLRPNGDKGELCVSLEGFARYQKEEAWTWEHMALARARVIYGSDEARIECEAIIADALKKPRNRRKLMRDAREMRELIATHKPSQGHLDIKHSSGGLIDLEFCIHVRQLSTGRGLSPRLDCAIQELGYPDGVRAAHQLMMRLLVMLRLVAPDLALPPSATRKLVAQACEARNWEHLMTQLGAAQELVAALWKAEIKG